MVGKEDIEVETEEYGEVVSAIDTWLETIKKFKKQRPLSFAEMGFYIDSDILDQLHTMRNIRKR